MEFREARSLALLARTQSLAQTAEQVNLTPAAVHKQIKNLEREFGVRLYEKLGRNVRLTQAAHIVLPYLEEMLSQYDSIGSALTDWKGLKRGSVRIGSNPAVSSYLMPSLLGKFRHDWPGVTPVLDVGTSSGLLDQLARRSLDVVVGHWDEPMDDRVRARARWEYDIVLVTSLAEVPRRVRLRELNRYPFVQLPLGGQLGNLIDAYSREHGLEPAETTVVNNSHTIISMIRVGLGIAMLPMWSVASDVHSGALRVIRQAERPLTAQMGVLTARSGYVPPPVTAFIELARKHSWKHLRLLGDGRGSAC
ncbi:MAG: LysR family transcriptional regulator [Bryobacterales bacterium]|nr:LysR family transcriptional regulator [Bryobacterales bacterium]